MAIGLVFNGAHPVRFSRSRFRLQLTAFRHGMEPHILILLVVEGIFRFMLSFSVPFSILRALYAVCGLPNTFSCWLEGEEELGVKVMSSVVPANSLFKSS